MIWESWVKKHEPVKNFMRHPDNDEEDPYIFEIRGDEGEYIRSLLTDFPKLIWTLVEHNEEFGIISGYHWVNRQGYYITLVPWKKDYEFII